MSFTAVRRRALAVAAGAAALTLGLALPALAHVTVNPGTAEQGGFTKVAFRVPNERDDASTTKLEVELPRTTRWRSCRCGPWRGGRSRSPRARSSRR
ncbi:DUF1775 domain-containing protein [Thermocatellispora tengchongensis]|uniref:DUF1775 domain-containing protein n=1 Tax=Thermocatellispora tengchongensis TaxID=1073253 RepID=UPI003640034F